MTTTNLVGALPTNGTYSQRKLTDITTIVLHHSVGYDTPEVDYVRAIARYHVNDRGWPGIGYHRCIGYNGDVFLTNPLEAISYHARRVANPISVGICLLGDYRTRYLSQAQMDALLAEISRLDEMVRDASDGRIERLDIRPHSYYVPTECPGDNIRQIIPTLERRHGVSGDVTLLERVAIVRQEWEELGHVLGKLEEAIND